MRLYLLFGRNHAPRLMVFFFDVGICFFSVVLAYTLRFNFSISQISEEFNKVPYAIAVVLLVRALSFYLSRTYAGIVRYTSTKDAERIFYVITAGSVFFGAFNIFTYKVNGMFVVPYSVIVIDYITAIFLMTSIRLFVKTLYLEYANPAKEKRNVIIYGAGEAGLIAKRALDRDAGTKYRVTAFIDDDRKKSGKKLEGITIHHCSALKDLLKNNEIAHLIISLQNLPTARKQYVVETCLSQHTKVLNVPPVHQWINGELSFRQIKKIRIEDLLPRKQIHLDEKQIRRQLRSKTVLVTGAAGSIGSELVRQIARFEPKKIILLDLNESPLYNLELELQERHRLRNFEIIIGDVRNRERVKHVFRQYNPQVVFHAAAYKHVPMMEYHPSEAVITNVMGTVVVADLSVEHDVETFVFVSTDKAVNPTNIMGASKRIAEIYVQSLYKNTGKPRVITTRFGNVLGSTGSVIPRFEKQIQEGGPITVTHPEITRYFMTIPEACQLVLEAGTMGKGGEIFLFDMGKSLKIVDLAKKMIQLSNLTLGKDIQLVYTGLRPGEKLHEELLNVHENSLPTHHPQIMIAKVREYDFLSIAGKVETLIRTARSQNNETIVQKMKELVPEFVSSNPLFENAEEKVVEEQTAISH